MREKNKRENEIIFSCFIGEEIKERGKNTLCLFLKHLGLFFPVEYLVWAMKVCINVWA